MKATPNYILSLIFILALITIQYGISQPRIGAFQYSDSVIDELILPDTKLKQGQIPNWILHIVNSRINSIDAPYRITDFYFKKDTIGVLALNYYSPFYGEVPLEEIEVFIAESNRRVRYCCGQG